MDNKCDNEYCWSEECDGVHHVDMYGFEFDEDGYTINRKVNDSDE